MHSPWENSTSGVLTYHPEVILVKLDQSGEETKRNGMEESQKPAPEGKDFPSEWAGATGSLGS